MVKGIMKDQLSFSSVEYGAQKKVARREKILDRMEELVPLVRVVELVEPNYPKGKRGRPPMGLE